MAQLDQSERDDLEALIDRHDLQDVVAALATICNDKGEHLRSNWQDAHAAKAWERDAAKLDKLSAKLEN